jgi:hypothetical protein
MKWVSGLVGMRGFGLGNEWCEINGVWHVSANPPSKIKFKYGMSVKEMCGG